MFLFILRKSNNKSNRTLFLPKLALWRAFFVANFPGIMRKFLLIEGYLVGENELNGETFKKKYQSYIGEDKTGTNGW